MKLSISKNLVKAIRQVLSSRGVTIFRSSKLTIVDEFTTDGYHLPINRKSTEEIVLNERNSFRVLVDSLGNDEIEVSISLRSIEKASEELGLVI